MAEATNGVASLRRFGAGDVVRLRSGGPAMTVARGRAGGGLDAAYYDARLGLVLASDLPEELFVPAAVDFDPASLAAVRAADAERQFLREGCQAALAGELSRGARGALEALLDVIEGRLGLPAGAPAPGVQ
jgi:uncharacterized protein YodC (DUF2158 family)